LAEKNPNIGNNGGMIVGWEKSEYRGQWWNDSWLGKIRITQRRTSFRQANYASIREAAVRQYAVT